MQLNTSNLTVVAWKSDRNPSLEDLGRRARSAVILSLSFTEPASSGWLVNGSCVSFASREPSGVVTTLLFLSSVNMYVFILLD